MDFRPSEDQLALQRGVRDVCADLPPAESWAALVSLGVFGLRAPEERGGAGLGLTDAALVFEELGRALAPGPLVGTELATWAGVADGVVGVVAAGSTPVLVEHLDALDALLVLGADDVRLLSRAEVGGTPVPKPLDPATPLWEVSELPAGRPVGGAELAGDLRRAGAVLTAALQVGIAQATLDRAVTYARGREQFDRPIGTFQAVQHLLADMLVRVEVARVALHAAAVTVDDPPVGDVARAVSGAKLLADEAARLNARTCVQVHGGMGFTWEVDVHLFLKRAAVLATTFGSVDEHAELVAELV